MHKQRSAYAPLLHASYHQSECSLVVFAAAMRCFGMGRAVGRCVMRRGRMGAPVVVGVCRCWTTSIRCVRVSGVSTGADVTASVVPASSAAAEAMLTPAVAVAPVCPRAHAQEDAVIEISRPVKAAGCAAVWRIVVVAVGTDGLYAYAYANCDLRAGRWHQGQGHEQGCCTCQEQTEHCEPVGPRGHALELPHFVVLRNFCLRWKGMSPVSGPCE